MDVFGKLIAKLVKNVKVIKISTYFFFLNNISKYGITTLDVLFTSVEQILKMEHRTNNKFCK